jgi:hypothetical protein
VDTIDGTPVDDPAVDSIPAAALPEDDAEFASPPPLITEPAGEPA